MPAYDFNFRFGFSGRGGGGSVTPPGGSDGNIQFNDAGSFGGASDFNYDKVDSALQFVTENDNSGFTLNPSNAGGNQSVTVQGDLEGGSGSQAELILGINDGVKTNQIFITPSGISLTADEGNVLLQTGDATGIVNVNGPDVQLRGSGDIIVEVKNDGTDKLGFFAHAPVAKPTVTGSKGGNAALASLITALASLGLITDSTT